MKGPWSRVVALIFVGCLAIYFFRSRESAINERLAVKSPATPPLQSPAPSRNTAPTAAGAKPSEASAVIPQMGAIGSPRTSARVAENANLPQEASAQPLPIIRNGEAPVPGRTEMVPGHFDGVMVSHVPLAEPPPEVKPGIPRTPPTVIHPAPENGGGTLYLLDSTWDTPVQAPPAAASAKGKSSPNPPSSPSK